MAVINKYPKASQPIKIGNVTLKNRIITLPMMSALPTPDGKITSEFIAYCGRMARTGAGLVVIGDSAIDNELSMDHETAVNLGHDFIIPGLYAVTEEIHRYGAKASIELNHGGVHAFEALLEGRKPLGPSTWPEGVRAMSPLGPPDVQVMDKKMIRHVIDNYVAAVGRCIAGGFDMVTLHAGHGWLVSQFLSPVFNRRTDEYGGSFENRMRFALEILEAVRGAYGNSIAIDMRISASTKAGSERGDISDDELLEFVKIAQKYVDSINVSVSWAPYIEGAEYMCQSYFLPHMVNTPYAEKVRKVVDVPVTATGSIVTMAEAESIIASGKADMVGMGRANMADDALVWKSFRGMEEKIRPCLRCAYCTGRLQPPMFRRIRCAVNPMLGRELEYRFLPSKVTEAKKVMIIGGGISGMQAAQTAVARGHKVELYEKDSRLGGMLHTAAALPFKDDMKRYLKWMIDETARCGANIFLDTEVTPSMIEEKNPDSVLVAVGSTQFKPSIEGIIADNVVWAGDVDSNRVTTGERVIIAGAGLTGSECAIALAMEGKKVTIIDMMPPVKFLKDATGQCMLSITRLHRELNIDIIFNARITAIDGSHVKFQTDSGSVDILDADTIVNALGMRVDTALVESLSSVIPETYTIGDCSGRPMNVPNATDSGFTYALEL